MTDSAPLDRHALPHDIERACIARAAELSAHADSNHANDTYLFARLVAAREVRGESMLLGLTPADMHALFQRHFPHAAPLVPPACRALASNPAHATFVDSLTHLLLTHVPPSIDTNDAQCIAAIVAHACLRPDHLWRDLGLSGRDDVTAMLTRYFPALVARNVENLRWKKFLARELALSTGAVPGPAPGCPGCEDFRHCFPDGR
ncbi:nitrogen fixation protein NifQ [Paraburkholderia megapolitana]|uniref:Nitrogen fixation protein NifQ n=1 Tax=Paraburkholderia megapolitana TaxID=420953 RepID=A0A1I3KWW8_9BURK|nr:nitrogen fixation protein NifQ [Paraburkholderia megapolitana]QDQ80474.1 nitrogen fixation protein NifQ [Paraburkholderia megapolitana]SFI76595.1 nitrogen fixation protein NifQ [Paraburkholderia megapolitana]